MSQIPESLQAYVYGVGVPCSRCGQKVVEAVVTEEPYVCPSCSGEIAPAEDELTRAALEDTSPREAPVAGRPSAWRMVALLLVAIGALALVLGRR